MSDPIALFNTKPSKVVWAQQAASTTVSYTMARLGHTKQLLKTSNNITSIDAVFDSISNL